MNRKEEIKEAYRNLGKAHNMYDSIITGSSFIGRLVDRLVWQMDGEDLLEYQSYPFEVIPKDFHGKLLEVPVGTGIISMPVFKTLPKADITCLDYSPKMMESARKRAEELQIGNIAFVQGDVGHLPFADECFDAVVSLNGFHAFPDKEAAYQETYRVLKKGGTFSGCFYIEGSNTHTDRMIRSFYIRTGFFTPPFETLASLQDRLSRMYASAEVTNVESIGCFRCKK